MGAHTSILDPFPLRLLPLLVPCSLFLLDLNGGGGSGRLNLHLHCRLNRRPFSLSLQRVAIPAQLAAIPPACLAHPILLQELRPSHDPPYHPCSQPANSLSLANQALDLYFCHKSVWSMARRFGRNSKFQISCCGGMKGRRPCLPPRSTCLS